MQSNEMPQTAEAAARSRIKELLNFHEDVDHFGPMHITVDDGNKVQAKLVEVVRA